MNIRKNILLCFVALTFPCLLSFCSGNSNNGNHSTVTDPNDMIASVSPVYGKTTTQGTTQTIRFTLKDEVEIDSAVLSIDSRRIARIDTSGYKYKIGKNHPTGRLVYKITTYKDTLSDSRSGEFMVMAPPPVLYGHTVVKVYPHDANAYTQGLLWHDGHLYESTGLEGQSSLRKVDLQRGTSIQKIDLDEHFFGEGLALLNGKLYQLTWQNNKGFVYDLKTFEKLDEFDYNGEGWGLTSDGRHLYMSDGSENIYVLDPETFKRLRTLQVCTDNSLINYVNEMEWIEGEIWANVYTTNTIIRIDPQTGAITGVIDMSGLLQESDITPTTDVLNGIAYDEKTKRIFVTGKNWNKLFEIKVHPQPTTESQD